MKTITPERRKFIRGASAARCEINLLQARTLVPATSVNVSEGGLCLRLRQALEVRSLVRLRLTPAVSSSRASSVRASHPVECRGRVAWVVERLDLANTPPALYDVGIEFVDSPPALRQLMAQGGGHLASTGKGTELSPALIRDRRYVARLEREANQPLPWHLVVLVDGSPCFSGRHATKRQAVAAWTRFRRQQARQRAWEGKR